MLNDADLRARILGVRDTWDTMQEQIEREGSMSFAEQLIHESERYVMGEVIKLFNDIDKATPVRPDWGQLNRDNLARDLRHAYHVTLDADTADDVRDWPLSACWQAVADAAITHFKQEETNA